MSIAAFLAAADAIFTAVERFNTIRDLLVNNAGSAVTTQELALMVRQETHRFFTVIVSAQLDSIRNDFYGVILPTLANRPNITAADLAQGGVFFDLYRRLRRHIRVIMERFIQIRAVFFEYAGNLHVDDLVHGLFFMMRIFCLFVHMHTVHSGLRRIQLNLPSMDHPDLAEDTRRVLSMIASMNHTQRGLRAQYTVALAARRRAVGEPQHVWAWSYWLWKWEDAYRTLPSTPEPHRQTILPTLFETQSGRPVAVSARNAHLQRAEVRYRQTVRDPVERFWRSMDRLRIAMQRRLTLQERGGRNPRQTPRTMTAFAVNDVMAIAEEQDTTKDQVAEIQKDDDISDDTRVTSIEEADAFDPDEPFLPDYKVLEELRSLGIDADIESFPPLEVDEDLRADDIISEEAAKLEDGQAPRTA